MKQHQDAEPGWYAGPHPDEVYYCSENGLWYTSSMRREDTQYDMVKLVVDDPRIRRIEAQVEKVAGTRFPYITVDWLRSALRGQ
jgi:hypothetical protein